MDIWHEILDLARYTPSPHNVQPWKFRIEDPSHARLFMDKARMLPKEDLTGSFLLSAMGMMIEAIRLLAANRVYRLDVANLYTGQDEPLIAFADLTLVPDASVRAIYSDDVFRARRTSRLKYDPKPVPAGSLQSLSNCVAPLGHSFGYTAAPDVIEPVIGWNIDALFHDLNHPDYHDEITEYFRYTDKQSDRFRDGLDYRCMQMHPAEFWLTAKFPRLLTAPVIGRIMRTYYRGQIGPVATLGWIAGPFWEPENAGNAGKVLMHFWLEAARLGIYIHPFGNLVTNHAAAANIKDELKVNGIWLIFKLGYCALPPQSQRLPLKEIVID